AEGGANTAMGDDALKANIYGSFNTAIGYQALGMSFGNNNTGVGHAALGSNDNGSFNIGIGDLAGEYTNGTRNIMIGHEGVSGESYTTRIGYVTATHRTFIYGIRGTTAANGD